VGLAGSVDLTQSARLFIRYDGSLANGADQHAVMGGVKLAF
jgi:hypothetical protein